MGTAAAALGKPRKFRQSYVASAHQQVLIPLAQSLEMRGCVDAWTDCSGYVPGTAGAEMHHPTDLCFLACARVSVFEIKVGVDGQRYRGTQV